MARPPRLKADKTLQNQVKEKQVKAIEQITDFQRGSRIWSKSAIVTVLIKSLHQDPRIQLECNYELRENKTLQIQVNVIEQIKDYQWDSRFWFKTMIAANQKIIPRLKDSISVLRVMRSQRIKLPVELQKIKVGCE